MVRCSICKETGHSANNCNGEFIKEWTENIKRFWIYGHNNSVENDEAVKEWARTFRLTMPIINRLWANVGNIYIEKEWFKVDYRNFVQTRFYHLISSLTIADFRERIINYVRPTEEEPIAEALVELERVAEEERMRRMILRQVAHDEQQRQREQRQRERQRERTLCKQIQWKMDPLELKYFENTDCQVCMESLTSDNSVALDCRHTCCVFCLKQILKYQNRYFKSLKCPTCRADIKTIHFKATISSENFNTISAQINSLV